MGGTRQRQNNVAFVWIILLVGYGVWQNYSFLEAQVNSSFLEAQVNMLSAGQLLITTIAIEGTTPTATAETSFSKLQLFLSAFPGSGPEDENINGFGELRETFLRTLQFFWTPDIHWNLTVVLDEPANPEHRGNLTEQVYSLFNNPEDARDWVSVAFNPLTNQSLYGHGWYIQQLIMLWADNFTNAEYIGFVDDDTIITKAVEPIDIFDEGGRPRALVKPADEAMENFPWFANWRESVGLALGRPSLVHSMVSFPLVVKADHLRQLREEMLSVHSWASSFAEVFSKLIYRGENGTKLEQICQFCIIMDYLFDKHRDEYRWHIENTRRANTRRATATTFPLPRVAQHFGYLYKDEQLQVKASTRAGRRELLSEMMKEGYCYSLPLTNMTAMDQDRCKEFDLQNDIFLKGEWSFEYTMSEWLKANATEVELAHKRRAEHNKIRRWDEVALKELFE